MRRYCHRGITKFKLETGRKRGWGGGGGAKRVLQIKIALAVVCFLEFRIVVSNVLFSIKSKPAVSNVLCSIKSRILVLNELCIKIIQCIKSKIVVLIELYS